MVAFHAKTNFSRCSRRYLLCLLCFGVAFPLSGEFRVQAEADQVDHFENLPVPVTIIVTHPGKEAVDESTFVLGKDPIKVNKVKDVGDANRGEDILSIYRYDMPAKPKGLYVLSPVGVKIGARVYQSVASTFEIKPMGGPPDNINIIPSSNSAPSSVSSNGAFLKLESIINGPTTLYPGQTTVVGYRYSYNADIETTDEVTPLFDPKGFIKVGDKIVNRRDDPEASILEVTQRIEAETPGVYPVGPSSVEGYVYSEDSLGRRTYAKNKLKSVVPVITLTIKTFPINNQPASFNGAVGKYSFKVDLKSSSKVTVGDEISLLVQIGGPGSLEKLQLPDLCCQPGMSGVFKLSDLPPVGKIEGAVKKFIVNLRPLTPLVKAIPSLEFSYFDPETQKYVVLHSQSIPITVAELKTTINQKPESLVPAQDNEKWRQSLKQPLPIEVEANYPLTVNDLENLWFGSWWMLLMVPFGVFLLVYQRNLKRILEIKGKENAPLKSYVLFQEAWCETPHSSIFYAKLYQAFFDRLQERGDIDLSVNSVEQLPAVGAAGDVKVFLLALEESRYAEDKGVEEEFLLEEARRLFRELEVKS